MKRYKNLFLIIVLMGTGTLSAAEPVNALIHEESPYLQQHAHNPVHWYPWGKEAFEKARREHKPIFLSIGYSTCHWCHVMEAESFENKKVADLLNRYFVAIKVDREERPQIDAYYQKVYQLINRRGGGWPLTILLTPDRKPFFAGTYIPREEKFGQPGLLDLLARAAKLWHDDPSKIEAMAKRIDAAMKHFSTQGQSGSVAMNVQKLIRRFVSGLEDTFDAKYGGWGDQMKFPRATTLTALLQIYRLDGDPKALEMAKKSLEAMAKGGIYDQVEGGFFRYSTDRLWRIPHFEKMLYSNAELIEAYALAARVTGEGLFARVVSRSVATLRRHYRDASGLFYGASDADSLDPEKGKKEEGFYYTYRYDRLVPLLQKAGISHPGKALEACGITEGGNFIHYRSNPYLSGDCSPKVLAILSRIRSARPYPFVDRKMQASWNALLIHGLFAAAPLDRRYAKLGIETLNALKRELWRHAELYHQKLPGKKPIVKGLFEDYALTIAAAIDAYEWSQDPRWLEWAGELLRTARAKFYEAGRWYDSRGAFRNVLQIEGGSYRSPLAVMADDMLRWAALEANLKIQHEAEEILRTSSGELAAYPQAAPAGVLAWLAWKENYWVLKIPQKRLRTLRPEIEKELRYPFVLFKGVEGSLYQACTIEKCFLYDRNETAYLKKLKGQQPGRGK